MKLRDILCSALLVILVAGFCAPVLGSQNRKALQAAKRDNLKILFLGNSYTRPITPLFKRLASSAKKKVTLKSIHPGGWKLKNHSNSEQSLKAIKKKKWDYVVLQEQS